MTTLFSRPRDLGRWFALALVAAFLSSGMEAAQFYVAPGASASGTGSLSNPWRLQTALNHPAAVHAGDTIWLRGGTYPGTYISRLAGTSAAPIVVRAYPGEWPIIDGGNSGGVDIIDIQGAYTWFWGFEIMSSDTRRTSSQTGSFPTDLTHGNVSVNSSTGIKLINLYIHDTLGVGLWSPAVGTELYGCLIAYSGWNAPDGGYDHGIYAQNQTGTKRIVDNIVSHQFSHGLHVYTEAGFIDNFHVEGNVFFRQQEISTTGSGRNFLIGGSQVARNPKVISNYIYHPNSLLPASSFDMGYSAGCTTPEIRDNYIADNTYMINCTSGATITGNTFYGSLFGFNPLSFPSNTYTLIRPTGTRVFIRPNQYEPGRANIIIYNWSRQSTVPVNLTGIVAVGAQYQIKNAANYRAAPVLSGTYAGGSVNVPMNGLTIAPPIGWPAPNTTSPDFNTFVVIQTSAAPPSPTNFYTIAPCRVADTRLPAGTWGGPALAAGAGRIFPMTGRCGIPASAKSLALNVTATQPTAPGNLNLRPTGAAPTGTTVVHFRAGQTRASQTAIGLGNGGAVTLTSSAGTVHALLDAYGYWQ